MYVKQLPARPSVEQYRKQAKELHKSCQAGDSDAMARVAAHRYESGSSTLADAQFTIAREHGFGRWPIFARHIEGLRTGPVLHFERAADAIADGDLDLLSSLLRSHPELIAERSTRRHRATLLHYVSANGVEDFRQRTPANIVPIARLLLRSGAAPDAIADSYGGEDTTLGLLVSSSHPAHAGKQVELVDALLEFGAAVDGIHDDSEPLVTALAFHYGRAAEALVRRGARVDTVLTAAGLGRLEVVREFLEDDGTPRSDVRLAPTWPRLPRDPRRHVELALIWAAALGRVEVVDLLCAQRIDVAATDHMGWTALHWAAAEGELEVVDLLVRRGLPLDRRDNRYDTTALGCAVWGAKHHDGHFVGVVECLVAAGADVSVVSLPTGIPELDEVLAR